jgi:hypothetical protein
MDPKAMAWNSPPPPPRKAIPGELLFQFVRGSDHAAMSCELRFHGESWGWEAQFYERGEFLIGQRFDTRRLAIQRAEQERLALERQS